jgi:signal transduction histidine kinase
VRRKTPNWRAPRDGRNAACCGDSAPAPIVCHDTSTGDLPYDTVLAKARVGSYVVLPLFHGGRVTATLNVGVATAGAATASVVGLLSSLTASVMPIVVNLVTLEEQARAIGELEHFDALKNEFLALITHDMRTPLAVINGFAEQLQDRWSELPDGEKLDSVDAILRNGRHLYRLVEEGLEIARFESGGFAYEPRPVVLEDEVDRTVAGLPSVDEDRIRVSPQRGLPLVRCDPDRHWQILMNVLSNALKYSAPESPVEVELSRHNSGVQVSVRDHGPGIEPSDLRGSSRSSPASAIRSNKPFRHTGSGFTSRKRWARRRADICGSGVTPPAFYVRLHASQRQARRR